jgi:BASS family bile acid:Na+ symporter
MALMVFGVALGAGRTHLRAAFARPGLLARSLVAMFVVMPIVAVLIAKNFDLNRALLVALLLLALSPVPPILPGKQIKSGGSESFVLGLLVVSALAAIAIVPAGVSVIGSVFQRDLDVPFAVVGKVVGTSVLLPVVLGLAVAHFAPAFAAKATDPVAKVSGLVLLVCLLPILWAGWRSLWVQMENFTVLAMLGFIAIGLLAGHLLGGPRDGDRTALALATASRHPGVAIAVLNAIDPGHKDVVLVVVLYLIVGMVATNPYVRWRTPAQSVSKA